MCRFPPSLYTFSGFVLGVYEGNSCQPFHCEILILVLMLMWLHSWKRLYLRDFHIWWFLVTIQRKGQPGFQLFKAACFLISILCTEDIYYAVQWKTIWLAYVVHFGKNQGHVRLCWHSANVRYEHVHCTRPYRQTNHIILEAMSTTWRSVIGMYWDS